MSKIYLTESDIIKIVKDSAIAILNERTKPNKKEEINEGNSYKVDFDALGEPENKPTAGIGGFYMNRDRAKRKMASGEYGRSGMVGMHGFLKDLRELGYSDKQIQQGLNSGAIQLGDRHGNQYGTRKQNRKWARLNTLAGGVLGTGAAKETPTSSSADDSGKHGLLKPEDMGIAPAPVTKTVYYKSDKVKQLQTLLNEKFGASLNPDGVCGPLTIDAMLNALNSASSTESKHSEEVAKAKEKEPLPTLPSKTADGKEVQPTKAEIPTKAEPSIRDKEAKTTATTDTKQMLKEILGSSKTYQQNFEKATNYLETIRKAGKISYQDYVALNSWLRSGGAKKELEKMEQEKALQEQRKRNGRK